MQVFDFELSAEDMKVIESFNIPYRVCIPMIEVSGVHNSKLFQIFSVLVQKLGYLQTI